MSEKQYKALFLRIGRSEESDRLYALEEERNTIIKKCAEEWSKLTDTPKEDYWTVAIPTALLDLLESFGVDEARAACKTFLELHGDKDLEITQK